MWFYFAYLCDNRANMLPDTHVFSVRLSVSFSVYGFLYSLWNLKVVILELNVGMIFNFLFFAQIVASKIVLKMT